jgi:hypothetical protein
VAENDPNAAAIYGKVWAQLRGLTDDEGLSH